MMQDRRNTVQKEGYTLIDSFISKQGVPTEIRIPSSANIQAEPETGKDTWFNTPEELGINANWWKETAISALSFIRLGAFTCIMGLAKATFWLLSQIAQIIVAFIVLLFQGLRGTSYPTFEDNYGSRRRTKRRPPQRQPEKTINIFIQNDIKV